MKFNTVKSEKWQPYISPLQALKPELKKTVELLWILSTHLLVKIVACRL